MSRELDKLKRTLKALSDAEVRVGWFEDAEYPDGMKVATVAYIQEHGATRTLKNGNTVVIPARSALRISAETQEAAHGDTFRAIVAQAVETGNVEAALNQIGAVAASHVKDTIASNLPVPNAESTINGMILGKNTDGSPRRAGSSPDKGNRKFGQGKGSARTLVDTGQMLKTVQWEVN